MGGKQKIKMQRGYPTTDGVLHEKLADALKSQANIDLTSACNVDVDIDETELKYFLLVEGNAKIVSEYIKRHLTETKKKPASKKKRTPSK